MAAKIPPAEYLSDWADTRYLGQDGRIARLSGGKQKEGYNIGEAPGSSHLNYMFNRIGNWQEMLGRALAGKNAYRNIDFTQISPGPTANVDSYHIDYYESADRWYATGVDANGGCWVTDSADGITWNTTQFPAGTTQPGVGATGDASKVATDGTICAIATDNGTQAKVYTSTDLTVANLDGGTNIDATAANALESSDLTYDHEARRRLWGVLERMSDAGRGREAAPNSKIAEA